MFATLTLPPGMDLAAARRAPTVRVRSADDLRNAVRLARAQALTLDGTGMDRVLRLDTARGQIEVQAATRWSALAAVLARDGIELEAFAAAPGLPATVGEAVSSAAAGPDGLPVTAHVVAATLVMPDGELRRADRDEDDREKRGLLALALGGQGVIGVFYSLTLSVDSLRRSAGALMPPAVLDLPAAPPPGQAAGDANAAACLLPPDTLDAFLLDLRAIVAERQLALAGVAVRRTLPEASCRLNWATREWATVDIRLGTRSTLGASVVAAEVRRALLAAAMARGGSFPVSDLRDATRAQLEACYPMLPEFLAEKRRGDPAERLQNAWYRNATAALRPDACEVRWDRR